jgi:hypothetical protein
MPAFSILDVIRSHAEPDPLDQRLFTAPAERIFSFSGNIAFIDIPEPRIKADLPRTFERGYRCRGLIQQLVRGMEP